MLSVCISLTFTADPRVSEYVSGNSSPGNITGNICCELDFVYSSLKHLLLMNWVQAKTPSGRTSRSSLQVMPTLSATGGCS